MSLVLHCPFNGDIKNYAGSIQPYSSGTVAFDNNGRTGGKCLTTGTISISAADTQKLFNSNSQSIAFWYYNLGTSSTAAGTSHIISGVDSNRRLTFYAWPNCDDFHITVFNQVTNENNGYALSDVLPFQSWTHLVATYENNTIKVYINGQHLSDRDITIPGLYTDWNVVYPLINNSSLHKINDFRVYNHALSANEINEIYKTKIVHFDFNSQDSEPTTNVVTNTNLDTGWSKDYCGGIRWNDCISPVPNAPVVSFYNNGSNEKHGYWYSYGDYAPQTPGVEYTVSIYVKTRDSNFRIQMYTADNSETGRVMGATLSVPNDMQWHRLTWTFTNPTNSQSDSLSFKFWYGNADNTEDQRTWLCAPQMEAKDHATPFVVGTREGGGFYDISGQNHNGSAIVAQSPTYSTDTNLGNGCYAFNGSNSIITISPIQLSRTFTIAMWIYSNDNDRSIFFGNYSNGTGVYFNIEKTASNLLRVYWNANPDLSFSPCSIPLNTWIHIAVVIDINDTTTVKVYKNGTLVDTRNTALTDLTFTGNMYLGKDNRAVSDATAFNGKISDFRIYASALTDDDIRQLYNSKAVLDNTGNFNISKANETKNIIDFDYLVTLPYLRGNRNSNDILKYTTYQNVRCVTQRPDLYYDYIGDDTWIQSGSNQPYIYIFYEQFEPNTQYIFDLYVNSYVTYQNAEVTSGYSIIYTDGTTQGITFATGGDWQNIKVYSDASKSIKGIISHYYVGQIWYLGLDSTIKAVTNPKIDKKSVIEIDEVIEENTFKPTLVDYSSWKDLGVGSVAGFNQISQDEENKRIIYPNPWGALDYVWEGTTIETKPDDGTEAPDGGFETNTFSIDSTKKYRVSVWIKLHKLTSDTSVYLGGCYFGCYKNSVTDLGTTTVNTNPYFMAFGMNANPTLTEKWMLFVAYIWPSSYTGSKDGTSAIYDIYGNKLSTSPTDYKWVPNITTGSMRAFIYYCDANAVKAYFYRPRFELVESAISINDLIQGKEHCSLYMCNNSYVPSIAKDKLIMNSINETI